MLHARQSNSSCFSHTRIKRPAAVLLLCSAYGSRLLLSLPLQTLPELVGHSYTRTKMLSWVGKQPSKSGGKNELNTCDSLYTYPDRNLQSLICKCIAHTILQHWKFCVCLAPTRDSMAGKETFCGSLSRASGAKPPTKPIKGSHGERVLLAQL